MDVSVLICTIPARKQGFNSLLARLNKLKNGVTISIEILHDDRTDITIGEKRNALLSRANGTYSGFIDDDDDVTDVYFSTCEAAIRSDGDYDCLQLTGHYFFNGKFIKPFLHSIQYDGWSSDANGYYRYANHLNLIKTSISKQIGFINVSLHEDIDFSERLFRSGLCKKEFAHDNVLYLYYKIDTSAVLNKRMQLTFY